MRRVFGLAILVVALTAGGAAGRSEVQLPAAGFLTSVHGGVGVAGMDGRVLRRLPGYSLFRPRGLNTQILDVPPLFVHAPGGRTLVLDLGRSTFVAASPQQLLLPGGLALVQHRRRIRLEGRGRNLGEAVLSSGVFVSERRDVVTMPGPTASRGYVVERDINRMIPKGCRVATAGGSGRWFLLCGYPFGRGVSTVKLAAPGRVRQLVGPAERVHGDPRPAGWWTNAYLSPDRRTLLLQWSGQCEAPAAYVVAVGGGKPRPLAPAGADSIALGWSPDGHAVVEFPRIACGAGIHKPGIYLVDARSGRKTYVRRDGAYFRSPSA